MRGLYIHIPFCMSKCSYCDFYSFVPDEKIMDRYLSAVLSRLEQYKKSITDGFDTIYFGGGTPSFFGGERLAVILKKVRECFSLSPECEITVECNPSSADEKLALCLKNAGVNRISMGVQSAVAGERKSLGRLSGIEKAKSAVNAFRSAGITNISLDLMLGIPGQTMQSLDKSLDFIFSCGAKHVSAYMLSLEEGTPLYRKKDSVAFPDEDETADMYLHAVKRLSENGFRQYEISNFSVPGFESRHNLKYWKTEEYLGIGPSAHSFISGKRFFFDRDIENFMNGAEPVSDGGGGSAEEYIMLTLRLSEGVNENDFFTKYRKKLPQTFFEKAKQLQKAGLTKCENGSVSLTAEGFLLSNSVIAELLCEL